MNDTGFVLDPRFMDHDTGHGHPERRERIGVLLQSVLEQPGLRRVEARIATPDELTLVHDEGHFDRVARTQNVSAYAFDADTPVCAQSFATACLAAGGLLNILDEVMAGRLRNGFAFVRPPGHHAERGRAMGFCLFNNVAVAAAYLRRHHGLDRVMIVDWDVHHGNGTQHMFERDPGVLFVSAHRYPFYPGTGAMNEVGDRDGEGFTVNLPFVGGFGDAEYVEAFHNIVEPIAAEYAPQFVLISAGFDAHRHDPLGGMSVSENGFAAMTRSLVRIAERSAGGRAAAVLEGGYDLHAMRDCSARVLSELRTSPPEEPGPAPTRAQPILEAVRRLQRNYWKI